MHFENGYHNILVCSDQHIFHSRNFDTKVFLFQCPHVKWGKQCLGKALACLLLMYFGVFKFCHCCKKLKQGEIVHIFQLVHVRQKHKSREHLESISPHGVLMQHAFVGQTVLSNLVVELEDSRNIPHESTMWLYGDEKL